MRVLATLCACIRLALPVFFLSFYAAGSLAGGAINAALPAIIVRVEGDGIAKVKKNIGTEVSAGANGKVYPGDRVFTDEKSTVLLMINDGSIIKIGFSSEFRVEKNEMNERFLSWAFRLEKGSMRALVEKNPNPETRFRVNTPNGTVGVRGTELVVSVDEKNKTSFIYVIEGLISYGPSDCELNNSCLKLSTGNTISDGQNESKPLKPRLYQVHELFGLRAEGAVTITPENDERMSLFREARKVTARFMQDTGEAALTKLVAEATTALSSAQDRAIGRSKEERVAMYAAMKEGSWNDTLEAADAYSEQLGIFEAEVNGGAENMLAQALTAKFRLGSTVKEAYRAGVFGADPGGMKKTAKKWDGIDLAKIRKNVAYEKVALAKLNKSNLERDSGDYESVLEFAEALPAPGSPASSACSNLVCALKRLSHQYHAVSEGVVDAFNEKKYDDNVKSVGRLPVREKGWIKSLWFRRAIPGNGCFQEIKDCKSVLCTAYSAVAGKKCKKGERVTECATKKILVRCKD